MTRFFSEANNALKEGRLKDALDNYVSAVAANPPLARVASFSISVACKRYADTISQANTPTVDSVSTPKTALKTEFVDYKHVISFLSKAHDCISFDIWDTVLRRDCHPDEVKLRLARALWLLLQKNIKLAQDTKIGRAHV